MEFVPFEVPKRARAEETKAYIHDACAFELTNGVTQRITHALDLVVFALGQGDAEHAALDLFHHAGLCDVPANIDTRAHEVDEVGADAFVYGDDVLLFMGALG